MPLVGWALGLAFAAAIRDVDHWIAFGLLAFIGAGMVYAGLKGATGEPADAVANASGWGLVVAAFATSIDAAAAGVTLPILGLPVYLSCAIIGIVTFSMSIAGVFIGAAAGVLIGKRAEVIGGLVLIGIGAKILIEHRYFGA